jgi:hypothetical protein
MMDDEEYQADLTRLTHELEDAHAQEADRKTAEIMEKLDLQALNAGINKTVSPTSLEAAHNIRYTFQNTEAQTMMIAKQTPDYNITFQNTVDGKQVQVGKLDFNGAMLKFEGNADQSAMLFIHSLTTTFRKRLDAEHVSAAKLLTEFVTFELDGEMELDDGYRKGFNDAIHAVRGILSKKIKEMENKP